MARARELLAATPHGILCPARSSTGFCNCDHKVRTVAAALAREAEIRAEERERCAQIAVDYEIGHKVMTTAARVIRRNIASAIRSAPGSGGCGG
jgi:hypothetical protein